MIEWRLFEVKQHKYKLVLGWVIIFLYDAERHVTTAISIKGLPLEGTHGNYVSSGLEGLLPVTTWSFWDFSSVHKKSQTLINLIYLSYNFLEIFINISIYLFIYPFQNSFFLISWLPDIAQKQLSIQHKRMDISFQEKKTMSKSIFGSKDIMYKLGLSCAKLKLSWRLWFKL